MTQSDQVHDDPGTPEEISRRKFLAGATVFLGSVVGLSVAVPAITSLVPTEEVVFGHPGWWPLDAAEMSQLAASTDKPIKVYFTHHEADGYNEIDARDFVWGVKLSDAGLAKLRSTRPDLPDLKVVADGIVPYPAVVMNFVMFSPVCPHLGCHFDWNDAANKFLCPCHGSEYTAYGEHIAGPAPRGLDPLPLEFKSGVAEITWIRYKQGEPTRLVVSYS